MPDDPPTIDALLNILPTPHGPEVVQSHLASHPNLAHKADVNGYTLLHAASSYAALDVLKSLVKDCRVDPNIKDQDGDTPLFYAETVAIARCLVEELGANAKLVNNDGKDAVANARANADDGEGGWDEVADYLQARLSGPTDKSTSTNAAETETQQAPLLPPNVQVNLGTMSADELDAVEADPEFRARIEALAARQDFGEESGQRDLRALVEEAVGGLEDEQGTMGGDSKRRAG